MHYYEVAPTKIVKADACVFTYSSQQPLAIGAVVIISIGQQLLTGIVVKKTTKPDFATKEITTILDLPPLPHPLLLTA